jgi:hypothetical protein
MQTFFAVLGACAFVYFVIRVGATVVDIMGRWRRNDW